MKIALITVQNANNYGAILQAFAMQEVLKKFGDVEVLHYKNRHISRSFDLIRFKPTIHGLLGSGKDVCRVFPRYRVIKKFKRFIAESLNLTDNMDYAGLVSAEGYDLYVAGSDQIWNPDCVGSSGKLDLGYFLDFVPSNIRKISYASSMGSYRYTDKQSEQVKSLLSSFNSLAVREEDTQKYLQILVEKPVKHVLDPTLLLKKNEWRNLLSLGAGNSNSNKYILLYTVPKVPLLREVVSFYSKLLNLEVISIDQGLSAGAKVDRHIRDAGPLEFIELFDNAEFIITDSFHGTCFSLIFQKPFVAVSTKKHSNRIESLLSLVGLENRLIKESFHSDDAKIDINVSPKAYERLDKAREDSIDYITKSINNDL